MERTDLRVAIAIALLSAGFLFVGLGRYGVVNGDEAIYHGIAERMVETRDWWSLDFRGERRVYDTFMNAPLHYWGRAALISAFGSSLFTMRALSALFGVLVVVATFALGSRLAGRRAGVLAAAVQLTTFQFVYLHGARTGELDTLASFFVVASCLAFLRGVHDGRSFVPHHLALAGLLMTKLPLVILPIVAELVWLALHPEQRRHVPRYLKSGLLVLPFALLWHVPQAVAEREHVARVLGAMLGQASGAAATDGPDLGLLGNARFYARTLLHGALPWAAAYPVAIAAALARPERAPRRIAIVYAAVVIAFFCAVSKHYPWYVMPAYPFLSVLVGAWLADLWGRPQRGDGAFLGAVAAAVAFLGVDPLGANPFSERALVIPMEVTPRSWLGLGPLEAIALFGGAFAAVWVLAGERVPDPVRRGAARAFVAGLLAFAALRVAAPLVHLDHQSRLDRIHREVTDARRAGRPLDYPIRLGAAPPQIARFLFGEDFEIVTVPTRRGTALVLHPRADPRVLDRSIGRAGLEWRFERARQGQSAR